MVERIAVGNSLGGGVGSEAAVRARTIENNDLLTPDFAKSLGDKARDDVRSGTGRGVGDHRYRFLRIVAFGKSQGGRRQGHKTGNAEPKPKSAHFVPQLAKAPAAD